MLHGKGEHCKNIAPYRLLSRLAPEKLSSPLEHKLKTLTHKFEIAGYFKMDYFPVKEFEHCKITYKTLYSLFTVLKIVKISTQKIYRAACATTKC